MNAIIVLNIIKPLYNKFVSDIIISIFFSENRDTKVKSNRINCELVWLRGESHFNRMKWQYKEENTFEKRKSEGIIKEFYTYLENK